MSVSSVASYHPPPATKSAPPPPPAHDKDGDEATESASQKAAEAGAKQKSFALGQGQNVNIFA